MTGIAASILTTAVLIVLIFNHNYLLLAVDATLRTAPDFLPVKGEPYNPRCVADGEKRLLEEGNFDLCTFAPNVPGGQTLWAMGDSHAGHLQGLLYRLHETAGIGVHLIETPGRPYPYTGPAFEPREQIVSAMYERARPGDALLVSRMYLDRGGVLPLGDLKAWSAKLKPLARQLATENMQLIVVGPTPMFDFEDPVVCLRPNSFGNTCARDRKILANSVSQVESLLKEQLSEESNAHVFSVFNTLCPTTQTQCMPIHDGLMLYRDRDHLNSSGSAILAEPLKEFLQTHGLFTEGSAGKCVSGGCVR